MFFKEIFVMLNKYFTATFLCGFSQFSICHYLQSYLQCHCHPIISCSSKIQNGLPFWCRLTEVVMKKGLETDLMCSSYILPKGVSSLIV